MKNQPFRNCFTTSIIVIVIVLSLLIVGCGLVPEPTPTPVRFSVQSDESNFIEYGFGGGELGADWTQLYISGDGRIMYQYTFPSDGTGDAEFLSREYQLSPTETEVLFQSLVDEGFFDLTDVDYGGVDADFTLIKASVDGHQLEVMIEGWPAESIHGKMREIVDKIHPEKQQIYEEGS